MKLITGSVVLIHLLVAPALLQAQTTSSIESSPTRGVDLNRIIESVAKKTSKKFIVDPRVRGEVTVIGAEPLSGDYAQLLSVLDVHGFTAVESGGYVHVIPDANARQAPVPIAVRGKQYADSEVVTKIIAVKSLPAAQIIPLLRPMLPQAAHLAALPCTNTLVVVDRFANVNRIQGVIDAMDNGEPLKPRDCSTVDEKK